MNPRKGQRLRPYRSVLSAAFLVVSLASAVPVAGQSVLNGSIAGTANDDAGRPVPGAIVTLRSLDLSLERETQAGRTGGFSFSFVIPGQYELRFEAVGYVPRVIRPISIRSGAGVSVAGAMRVAEGVVTSIDTVAPAGGAGTVRVLAGGTRVSALDLARLPDRERGVGGSASILPTLARGLGLTGLPGSMAGFWIDGVPFEAAGHPTRRTASASPAVLPRSGIGTLDALGNATDAEWGGSSAGYVTISSASNVPAAGAALEGGYSGDPLWSSSELTFGAPVMTSTWGSGAVSVDVAQDTSRLFLAGDFSRQQHPTAPRASDPAGLTALGDGLVAELTAPAVETFTRAAGLARLDWWFGENSRFAFRASGGFFRRESDGSAPARLELGSAAPAEGVDVSASGALVTEYRDNLTIEARGGVSVSSRTFGTGTRPTAFDAATGIGLGDPLGGTGETRRIDVFFSPVAHADLGAKGLAKGGIQLRATQHNVSFSERSNLFGSAAAAAQGRGAYYATAAPEIDFAPSEIGAFAQYQWRTDPGLVLTVGARYDIETLPTGAAFNSDWAIASGLRNDTIQTTHRQIGLRSGISWDLRGDGTTRLFAEGSLHQGSVAWPLLYEVFARDGATTVSRAFGTGLDWPASGPASGAATLPTISMFGPDLRAPQSLTLSGGLISRLGDRWSVFAQGTSRRTDFLMRRRNLNVGVLPAGSDAFGRTLLGDLAKDGALVVAAGQSHRRFPTFDDVWALDPDGWSEYRGGMAGIEYQSEGAHFYAAYTRSETTDNWFGAGAGWSAAELLPVFPDGSDDWDEAVSDLDVPERAVATLSVDLGPAVVSGVYRYRSSLPFTPGYRAGVDVNGDGSGFNDMAFVPALDQLGSLTNEWSCLRGQAGRFAARNSCRGPTVHSLDASLAITAVQWGGRDVAITIDAFGLIEPKDGYRDTALLLVSGSAPLTRSPDGTIITVPTVVNPDFGSILVPSTTGRMLRVGVRIGGPQR